MRSFARFFALPLLVLTVAACDESSVDLGETTLVGSWDGVGSLWESDDGRGLRVSIQSDANGVLSGTWVRNQATQRQGALVGSIDGQTIRFTLVGFPGDDPTFEGGLTSEHRMAGGFTPVLADGDAVFRRGSFDP